LSIGTFLTGIVAKLGIRKVLKSAIFKEETLYGDEAIERFEYMKATIDKDDPGHFGPAPYAGGTIHVPKFEVSKHLYDQQTMRPERRKYGKEVRYFDTKDGVIVLEGWRLK
jgi:hypothetical protein